MDVEITGYKIPLWEMTLIIVDCAAFVVLAAWGFLVLKKKQ
jgi:hypothetical protein